MKKLNIIYPLSITIAAIAFGVYLNYSNGLTWEENFADMKKGNKVLTYCFCFIAMLIYKNRKRD